MPVFSMTHMQFRVRARSNLGDGELSDVVVVMTTPGAPVAMLLDEAEQVDVIVFPESLSVSWTVPPVRRQDLHHMETSSLSHAGAPANIVQPLTADCAECYRW